MGRYRHLGIEEREDIIVLRRVHASVGEIARRTRGSRSTISRELARNSCRAGSDRPYYRTSAAQARYQARRARRRRSRLLDDPGLRSMVQPLIIERRWSPEQVAGRMRLEGAPRAVSRSTICRAIDARRLDTPELAARQYVKEPMGAKF